MQHFLAYGNSDQASFRDPTVKQTLDFMIVPGTIAAYYPDATAAFVLASGLRYVIDPRTPLFQENIRNPRASHFELGGWLGEHVDQRMKAHTSATSIRFTSDFYTGPAVSSMVAAVLDRQRNYGGRAPQLVKKLQRYQLLAQQAAPDEPQVDIPVGQNGPPPDFILAPYFISSSDNDPWLRVNEAIWQACSTRNQAGAISPVVAVSRRELLERVILRVPDALSKTVFFWVSGHDERRMSEHELRGFGSTVAQLSQSHQLVNLYGSFFSIVLGRQGLWGMSNGLGYSEFRSWPELASTGAAPARYYIRGLHMYLPDATAQVIIDREPAFACDCEVCDGRRVVGMPYHQLKKHFALARRWEFEMAAALSKHELVEHLNDSTARMGAAAKAMPKSLVPDTSFLGRWARVVSSW